MDGRQVDQEMISVEVSAEASGTKLVILRSPMFKSLKFPGFRLFLGSISLHRAAMNMQMMVRSLLVYRLTGSAMILGLMSFAHLLPFLLLSLYGGVIADRASKKFIIISGQLITSVVSVAVGLLLTAGYLSVDTPESIWILVAASVVQGVVLGLTIASEQSIIPEIVGKNDLMNAVSLNSMSMNVLRLFTPALAGFLVDGFGFDAVYYTMAGLYLSAAAVLSFLPLAKITKITHVNSALRDIGEGLRYIKSDITVMTILLLSLFGVFLSAPYMTMMPIFAEDILMVGATGLGVLMSLSGVGAIIGSLILTVLPNRKRGVLMLVSSLVLGLALAGFSFSNIWLLSLALICLVGVAHAARMSLSNTLLQYYTDPYYRGRVLSVFMMEWGFMSFGAFAVGLMAESFGVQLALGSFAIFLAMISLISFVFLPRIRKLE